MAEQDRIVDLLRSAAPAQLPPAGFDHASVLAASRRAGARRQRLVAGGVAAAVVLLAGGAAVAMLGPGQGSDATASSAAAGEAAATTDPSGSGSSAAAGIVPEVRPPDQLPEDPPPPATPPGQAPQPLGAGSCGPADRAVYAALVQVFGELAAQQPFPVGRDCPTGTTGAGVLLTADGVVGRVEVLLGPAAVAATDGATGTATTADGRVVTVVSVPAGGSSAGPYADRLDDVARQVAAALA